MAVNSDTSEIAKQVAALPDQWKTWARTQIIAALTDQAKSLNDQHEQALEAMKAQLLQDHSDEIAALQAALSAAAPPAAAAS